MWLGSGTLLVRFLSSIKNGMNEQHNDKVETRCDLSSRFDSPRWRRLLWARWCVQQAFIIWTTRRRLSGKRKKAQITCFFIAVSLSRCLSLTALLLLLNICLNSFFFYALHDFRSDPSSYLYTSSIQSSIPCRTVQLYIHVYDVAFAFDRETLMKLLAIHFTEVELLFLSFSVVGR